jgi:hypothetical protein
MVQAQPCHPTSTPSLLVLCLILLPPLPADTVTRQVQPAVTSSSLVGFSGAPNADARTSHGLRWVGPFE